MDEEPVIEEEELAEEIDPGFIDELEKAYPGLNFELNEENGETVLSVGGDDEAVAAFAAAISEDLPQVQEAAVEDIIEDEPAIDEAQALSDRRYKNIVGALKHAL